MPPRVSVITRTKDRPLFLSRALSSIAAQSYEDWEVVIVNDGGHAATVRTAMATSGIAPERVRIVDNASATGRWPAANAGVREAIGEFVVLHDDDDSWHPDFLTSAVSYLDEHPERLGVVSRIQIIWEKRVGDIIEETSTEPFLPDSLAPLLMDQLQFNRFVPIAFLYRRTVHDLVGEYDESVPVVGDWLFNTRVLLHGPLEYLGPSPLVYWHQRPASSGIDGNSVIESSEDHALHDRLVRDDALRMSLARNGDGMALYLTHFIDQRTRQIEDLVRTEIAQLRDEASNPISMGMRRAWRRVRKHRTAE